MVFAGFGGGVRVASQTYRPLVDVNNLFYPGLKPDYKHLKGGLEVAMNTVCWISMRD